MLGLAIVIAGAMLGVGAVRRAGVPLARSEQLALAAATALTITPWALFLATWAFGFAIGLPVGTAILGAAGWRLGRRRRVVLATGPEASRLSWIALGVIFALLFHGHMLHAEASGLWTGGTTYGDLALHTTFASYFSQTEIAFDSPIAAGEPLTYPFLGDFLVACLVRGGWSMSTAFAVTGWISAMTGLALVDALARRMFSSRAAGTIAVWTIVLSGALVGMWIAATSIVDHGLPSSPSAMPSYANMWGRGVTWSNLVCDFLLPQRAMLSAFAAVWAIAFWLRIAIDEPDASGGGAARRPALALVAVLAGALPLLHVHSFLIAIGMLSLAVAAATLRKDRDRGTWWLVLVVAMLLAAPQLIWQFGQTWDAHFGRWNIGWRAPSGHFWGYWLRNWGVPLVLAPVALVTAFHLLRRQGHVFAVLLWLGAAAMFVAANLYQFQPHDWDNMKFFVYSHMGIAVLLGGALAKALAHGGARRVIAAIAIAGMTGTGALTLVRELDTHDQLASTNDLRIAALVRRTLPLDALVLTSDRHNHPVSMLAGRRIVMGYRGWLWTHGVDHHKLERDVRMMFAGGNLAMAKLRQRGVTHVFIGPAERNEWEANVSWYREHYRAVLTDGDVEVFDVRRIP
jgi:hypothetical protein